MAAESQNEKSGHNLFQEENAKMIQVMREFLK
jgi:hypothetical protein